ncbi:MAG: hypothetical protein HWQ43_00125 [Nostoc sp. JL31]|uniref:hypothetical protein n=1 Tax=Nostoc sp. JL31 TaxID=2815395 RepID=UPI0025CF9C9C|nr:hypothetical protein [Nostoc sp. JL31]MBN3887634.1 hypothetical protein [Nostoc sp. JL31]
MQSNNIPKITTKETEHLRESYPSLSHLEAGNIAQWLQERKDGLFKMARASENEADMTRVLGLLASGIGAVCYAVNPLAVVGGLIGGAAWLWFVVEHSNRTKEIAPLPFIRGNFIDALTRAGDYDARSNYQADHLANTVKFLERQSAEEYAFLHAEFENIVQYLTQVEPGKRFYAYRWMFGWFGKLKGRQLPTYESMALHLQDVTIDSRLKRSEVNAIAQANVQLPPTVDIKQFQSPIVDIGKMNQAVELSRPTELQPSADGLVPETLINLPLTNRANALIAALTKSGFQVEDMMSSQVIAIAGTQRGGKGTLAAILATLSTALDPGLNTQYFTAGVDVYPFACNLTSALKYPDIDADGADQLVARDLLKFLKGLDGSKPYSHKSLLLVIDEAMRLLSLLEESDRTWAIQYLLSRFAKSGGTLIIVLHGSNLTSVVGKATAGLADTFKQSVNFIGCVAQAVSAGGLRKMNVASGEYFKANPNNFGEPVSGGNLGMIPEWLKTHLHPGNGQPDPARTLLQFFPELVQEHERAFIPRGEKIAPSDAVNHLESIFSKPYQEVEFLEVEESSISEADLEQIVAIIAATASPPTSFAAIRNSRKWGKEKKSVLYLRNALSQLIDSNRLCGNEKDGFSVFNVVFNVNQ